MFPLNVTVREGPGEDEDKEDDVSENGNEEEKDHVVGDTGMKNAMIQEEPQLVIGTVSCDYVLFYSKPLSYFTELRGRRVEMKDICQLPLQDHHHQNSSSSKSSSSFLTMMKSSSLSSISCCGNDVIVGGTEDGALVITTSNNHHHQQQPQQQQQQQQQQPRPETNFVEPQLFVKRETGSLPMVDARQ